MDKDNKPVRKRARKRAKSASFDMLGADVSPKSTPSPSADKNEGPSGDLLKGMGIDESSSSPQSSSHEKVSQETSSEETSKRSRLEERFERKSTSTSKGSALGARRAVSAYTSVERQSREQRTVNNFLNGVALSLICGILVVASLATIGGYVLWSQIQDQSATVSLLENNTKERFVALEARLREADADLEITMRKLHGELIQTQENNNVRLLALQTNFEEYRGITDKTITELRAMNKSLERSLAYQRRRISEQSTLISRLERGRSFFSR